MTQLWRQAAWLSLLTALSATALLCCSAAAQSDRRITSVTPNTVDQGDTILLTISGENLPQGSVVVEFYPQHIALLSVLSASATRIDAQIKVPSIAPAGLYNIVIYNQVGEEAFGEGLLTVASRVLTPVFHDYDPKVIAKASEGFALMLTGDAVTSEVVGQLQMQWTQNDAPVSGLETTFAYGGRGTVVCAVSGTLPGGVLTGRVLLNGKPIYMVEVTIETDQPVVVGNDPAQLSAATPPYIVRILGSGFTASALSAISVDLSSAETTARPRVLELVDAASLRAEFSGPLPAGEYKLRVLSGTNVLYEGTLTLVEGATAQQPPIPEPAPEAAAPPAVTPPATIKSVEPLSAPPGLDPLKLTFTGEGLEPELLGRLVFGLQANGQSCELLFVGAGAAGFTCLFGAPQGGWPAGGSAQLSISDPQGALTPFSAAIAIFMPAADAVPAETAPPADTAPAAPSAGTTEAPAGAVNGAGTSVPPAQSNEVQPGGATAESWTALSATLSGQGAEMQLSVDVTATSEPWDVQQLRGTFTLLPHDPLLQAGGGLTLKGELSFTAQPDGTALGISRGAFAAGDLLVRLQYAGGAAQVTTLELAVANPVLGAAEPSPEVPAVNPEAVQVSLAPEPVPVDDSGFTLTLLVSGELPDVTAWSAVKLESDLLVLMRNSESFKPVAAAAEIAGRAVIQLRCERDRERLPDLAYSVLVEELTGAKSVPVRLSWPQLSVSCSADVQFVQPTAVASEEPPEEQGAAAEQQ